MAQERESELSAGEGDYAPPADDALNYSVSIKVEIRSLILTNTLL